MWKERLLRLKLSDIMAINQRQRRWGFLVSALRKKMLYSDGIIEQMNQDEKTEMMEKVQKLQNQSPVANEEEAA